MSLTYPATKTIPHTDDYHGTRVADPYRWLEDLDSPETQAWSAAQNELTNAYLAQIPQREKIRARLTELWNFPRVAAPFKRGGRYFQFRNTGLQNQDVLYTMRTLDSEPRVLLNPNTFSDDGTVALVSFSVSKDGKYLAYSTTTSGSDWLTWCIVKVESGEMLDDILEWSKFSNAAWMANASGFFYNRYDVPRDGNILANTNLNQKVYFHRLGAA
ncbi:MAG: S9 family peptidase, partial [Chloroflexi bacterium]|nr:S9 family peptidase [Chloroflexota bacterium]